MSKEIIILDKSKGDISTALPLEPQRDLVDLDWVLVRETINGKIKEKRKQHHKVISLDVIEPILVTVELSESQCKLGAEVHYTITFDQPITVPFIVPISVSDRNGNHITNIGCTVTDGVATGSFTMAVAGDFTVTDEAINYHHTVITAPLKLAKKPWLRVYQ